MDILGWNTSIYGCADTIVSDISNVFVEVLCNYIKVALVIFDCSLSNKSIMIGFTAPVIYLPNGTFIDQINKTPLLHVGSNSLLSTAHAPEFGMDV